MTHRIRGGKLRRGAILANAAALALALTATLPPARAQQLHSHSAPEKLGSVSFPTSCAPEVQKEFERGVALLHSFAYAAAKNAFQRVAEKDPRCAMAHWGIAMTFFHQLWEPPLPPGAFAPGRGEIQQAQRIAARSERERGFVDALALMYANDPVASYRTRALAYEHAMEQLASANKDDTEAQVFYALAVLATALPTDKSHANQKRAAELLEPLFRRFPGHPGLAHYLIHACDNAEMAGRGEAAARAYSRIAPSAPHALHMPSHIFTRLGQWDDSIASNRAARVAAHEQGDIGEELHAMDYLVYAYLQSGREKDAASVIEDLRAMRNLPNGEFKVDYAATAMPVRFAVERQQWTDAAGISAPAGAAPQVTAIAVWARALGLARAGGAARRGGHLANERIAAARGEIGRLRLLANDLRRSGNDYWATQVEIQVKEAGGWLAEAEGKTEESAALLRQAADEEDAVEKLPVTPGPIIPAREQLGELLLEQNQPRQALAEFEAALKESPGRRGALLGAARARQGIR